MRQAYWNKPGAPLSVLVQIEKERTGSGQVKIRVIDKRDLLQNGKVFTVGREELDMDVTPPAVEEPRVTTGHGPPDPPEESGELPDNLIYVKGERKARVWHIAKTEHGETSRRALCGKTVPYRWWFTSRKLEGKVCVGCRREYLGSL